MIETYTQKLYYKKWDHKVVLRVSHEWHSRHSQVKRKSANSTVLLDFVDQHMEQDQYRSLESTTWSGRHYTMFKTIFFKDPKLLDLLKGKFEHAIESIEKPMDAKHQEALQTERCIIRKKLFYDTYRYAMRIKTSNTYPASQSRYKTFDELEKWVKLKQAQVGRPTRDHFRINREWNMTVFFTDAQDAMLFRLSWPDNIDRVDRIKLLSEVTENEKSDAEQAPTSE